MDEDLREKLTKIIEGYAEIEEKLGDPAVLADQREYTRLSKEFANQAALVGKANDYLQACRDIDDAKEMLGDPDMREFAQETIAESEAKLPALAETIKVMLIPDDPADEKDIIVEIRGAAGGDEDARGELGDGQEREGALQPGGDRAHGLHEQGGDAGLVEGLAGGVEAGGQVEVEQVGDDLGVGGRQQLAAGCLHLGAQGAEVLNDAVVDDGDAAGPVRVGVDRRRAAVGRPARVADAADRGGRRGGRQRPAQVVELARGLDDVEPAGAHEGDAGGVVAAVLQAPQAVHEDGQGALGRGRGADMADNSTHGDDGITPAPTRQRVILRIT